MSSTSNDRAPSPVQWKRARSCRLKKELRNVTFGESLRLEVVDVERHTNVDQLWWTTEELAEIAREAEALAHLTDPAVAVCKPPPSAAAAAAAKAALRNDSIRGLETKTENGAWERFKLHRDASNAVLGAQEKHMKNRRQSTTAGGKPETDLRNEIAKVYMEVTRPARRTAYVKGLKDQKEAARYLDEKTIIAVAQSPKRPKRPTVVLECMPVPDQAACSPLQEKDKIKYIPMVSLPCFHAAEEERPVADNISNAGAHDETTSAKFTKDDPKPFQLNSNSVGTLARRSSKTKTLDKDSPSKRTLLDKKQGSVESGSSHREKTTIVGTQKRRSSKKASRSLSYSHSPTNSVVESEPAVLTKELTKTHLISKDKSTSRPKMRRATTTSLDALASCSYHLRPSQECMRIPESVSRVG
jgi:hypothetical protein